jgi:hypothetical protein
MVIIDRFLEARDTLNWPYRTAPLTSPALKPEKSKDSPTPVQDDQLMNEFFEVYKEYKAYTSLSDSDLRKVEMKKGFFRGLNQEIKIKNEKSSNPFKKLYGILNKSDVLLYLKLQY